MPDPVMDISASSESRTNQENWPRPHRASALFFLYLVLSSPKTLAASSPSHICMCFDQCVERKHPSLPLKQSEDFFFYLSVDVFGITGSRLRTY